MPLSEQIKVQRERAGQRLEIAGRRCRIWRVECGIGSKAECTEQRVKNPSRVTTSVIQCRRSGSGSMKGRSELICNAVQIIPNPRRSAV